MPFINLADALNPSNPPQVKISDTQQAGCSISFETKENSYIVTAIDLSKCQSSVSSKHEELKIKLRYEVSNRRLTLQDMEISNDVINKPYIVVKDTSGNIVFARKLTFDEKGHAEINKTILVSPGKQLFILLAGEITQSGIAKPVEVALATIEATYEYNVKVGPYRLHVKNGDVKVEPSDVFIVGGALIDVIPNSLPIEVSYRTKTSNVNAVGYVYPGSNINVPSLSLDTGDVNLDTVTATPYIPNDDPKIASPLGIVQAPKSLALELVGNSPTGMKPRSLKFDLGGTSISEIVKATILPTDEFLVYSAVVADKSRIKFIPFGSTLIQLLDILPARVFMDPEGEGNIMRVSSARLSLLNQKVKSLPVMVYYDYTFGSKDVKDLKPIMVGAIGTSNIKIVPLKTFFVVDASYGGPNDKAKMFSIKPTTQIKSAKVYFVVIFEKNGKMFTRMTEAKTLGDLEKVGISVNASYKSKELYSIEAGQVFVVNPIIITSNNATNVTALAFPVAVVVEDSKGQTTPYVLEFRDLLKVTNGILTVNKNTTLSIDSFILANIDIVAIRNGNVIYNPSEIDANDILFMFSEVPIGVGPFFVLNNGTVKHFSEVQPGDVVPPMYEFRVRDEENNSILVLGKGLKEIESAITKFIELVRPAKVIVEKRPLFSTHINYPIITSWDVALEIDLPKLETEQTSTTAPTTIYVDANGYSGNYMVKIESILTDVSGKPCATSQYEDSITGGKQVVISTNQLIGNMKVNQNCGVPILDGFKVKLYIVDEEGNKTLVDIAKDVVFLTSAPTCKIGEPITIAPSSQGSVLVRAVDCTQGQSTNIDIVVNPPQVIISNQTISLTSGQFVKAYRLTVNGTKPVLEEYQISGASFTIVKPGLYILIYEFVPIGIEKTLRGIVIIKATGYRIVESNRNILAEVAGTTSAKVEIDSGSVVSGVAPIYKPYCSVGIGGTNILSYAKCESPAEIARIRVFKDGIEVESLEVAREEVEGKVVATGVSASIVASLLLGGLL